MSNCSNENVKYERTDAWHCSTNNRVPWKPEVRPGANQESCAINIRLIAQW